MTKNKFIIPFRTFYGEGLNAQILELYEQIGEHFDWDSVESFRREGGIYIQDHFKEGEHVFTLFYWREGNELHAEVEAD